jgi:hypothetical protein
MAINFPKNSRSKEPFTRMAFLFAVLFFSSNIFAQSSSNYLRTKPTEKGKLHFIEPIEFNASKGSELILDIAITQVGKLVDTAIVNFTFTTKKHAPRIDSVLISFGDSVINVGPIENYYLKKKGNHWISRNGFYMNENGLRMMLHSSHPDILIYPREEKTPVTFEASSRWEKMVEIVPQIIFE